jgi:hypothetical protein
VKSNVKTSQSHITCAVTGSIHAVDVAAHTDRRAKSPMPRSAR